MSAAPVRSGTAPSMPAAWRRSVAREGLIGLVVLAAVLAAGFGLRAWLSFSDDGIYWPDEIYQSLEPAHRLVFGYGLRSWEFTQGARNWAFPGMIAGLLKLCAVAGLDAPGQYLAVVRLAFSGLGVATAYGCYLLARRYGASSLAAACGAAAFALAAPAIYFAPRAMSEVASALPVVLGLGLALPRSARRWERLLGAALLGLAVLFRLQNVIFAGALLVVPVSRRHWRGAAESAGVLLGWALLYGLIDRLTWGGWFHSADLYIRFNLIEGRAANWGSEPFSFYARVLVSSIGTGPAVVIGAYALFAVVRAPALFAATLAYLLLHSYSPHKDLRFVYPALPLLCALAGVGLDEVLRRVAPDGGEADAARRVAVSATLLLAGVASATEFRDLTFGDLGAYETNPPGPNLYYKPEAGAFDDSGPVNRLLIQAHGLPDLCGLKVETVTLTWTGGYTYLHRNVPLYPPWDPPPESGKYNYAIAPVGAHPQGEVVAVDDGVELVRVGPPRCVPDPDYEGAV